MLTLVLTRGTAPEVRHHGWAVVADAQGVVSYETKDAGDCTVYMRSTAKPFQALPMVQAGLHTALTVEELALACASHTGSQAHQTIAAGILKKAGVESACLLCGTHLPSDDAELRRLFRSDEAPTALHNNCSGKHAAMLYTCVHAGWPLQTYVEAEHPLQQAISKILQEWTDAQTPLPSAIDGCSLPTQSLPLSHLARLYARLVTEPLAQPLVEAMTTHPRLVGGEGRIDTVLMEVTQGRLLAKVGADGVMAIAQRGQPTATGLALKIADGSGEARDRVTAHLLATLSWLSDSEAADPRLAPFLDPTRRNHRELAVGAYQFTPS